MTPYQIGLYNKMIKLIKLKRYTIMQRDDRKILDDLFELDLDEDGMWTIIGSLLIKGFYKDRNPYHTNKENTLIFKKKYKSNLIYIKVKIIKDNNGDMLVLISFHKDYK